MSSSYSPGGATTVRLLPVYVVKSNNEWLDVPATTTTQITLIMSLNDDGDGSGYTYGHAVDPVCPPGAISVPLRSSLCRSDRRRTVANNTTASLRSSVYDIERLLEVFECAKKTTARSANQQKAHRRQAGRPAREASDGLLRRDMEERDVICRQTASPAD